MYDGRPCEYADISWDRRGTIESGPAALCPGKDKRDPDICLPVPECSRRNRPDNNVPNPSASIGCVSSTRALRVDPIQPAWRIPEYGCNPCVTDRIRPRYIGPELSRCDAPHI